MAPVVRNYGGGTSSKTTMCMVSMLYDICLFLHRKNPHEHFGFKKGEAIYVGLCNNTLTLSHDVQLKSFINMMNDSPFFQKMQARQAEATGKPLSKGKLALNLPNELHLLAGSQSKHLVGRAILNAMISELNIQSREGGEQAVNTVLELKSRLYTRFDRGEHLVAPGKLYLDSSKKETAGVLDSLVEEARTDKHSLIIEAPFWEYVKGSHKDKFSGKRFLVFKGTPSQSPFVLEKSPEEHGVEEGLCIDVPVELKDLFKTDPVHNLRDLAGVATTSASAYISSLGAINDGCSLTTNPVTKEVIELDLKDQEDLLKHYLTKDFRDHLDPNANYYVHFDLSKNRDRTGIAFTRITGRTEVNRFDRAEGLAKTLTETTYQTDLLFCLKAKPEQEIPIYKLENFLRDFKYMGYKIGAVSFDQFQSMDLMQRLTTSGYNVLDLSVDLKRGPYDTFRQALMERRWKGPAHPILIKELKELVDRGRKIDHPVETSLNNSEAKRPSKDLADAIAGSMWLCITNTLGKEKVAQGINNYFDEVALQEANKVQSIESQLLDYAIQAKKKVGKNPLW